MALLSLNLLLLLLPLLPLSTPKTFPSDIEALKSLLLSVNPGSIPNGSCLSSWRFSLADPCDSSFSPLFTCGLRCQVAGDNFARVAEIALDPAGYSGTLPPSIYSLPFLETLDLSNNNFYSHFPPPPPSTSNSLLRLSLSSNSFSGDLPDLARVSVSLREIYLDGNLFSGEINAFKLAGLRSLERLELQRNNLTGEIPDPSSLVSLNYFDASDNLLTGGFPTGFPPSLVEISLRSNRLYGEIPGPAVAGLPNLQVLDLSRNGLSGLIPRTLFQHPTLEQLTLSYNDLQWVEPPTDGGLSSELVAVDLGHNGLTGLLPGFLGSMRRLSAVDLGNNKFTGMIPVEYAMRVVGLSEGVAEFGRLILAENYLYGPIPGPMGAMREGSAVAVSLADNCLFRCPAVFFFCEDGRQKPAGTCREFNPVIP